MKLGHNLSLAMSFGFGLVALIMLHAFLHAQSVAASAITVGATLTSPFNLMGDTSGSLVNNATVENPTLGADLTAGGTVPDPLINFSAPPGVPIAGWSAALEGMNTAGDHLL